MRQLVARLQASGSPADPWLQQEAEGVERLAASQPGAVPGDEDCETWATIVGASESSDEVEDSLGPLMRL